MAAVFGRTNEFSWWPINERKNFFLLFFATKFPWQIVPVDGKVSTKKVPNYGRRISERHFRLLEEPLVNKYFKAWFTILNMNNLCRGKKMKKKDDKSEHFALFVVEIERDLGCKNHRIFSLRIFARLLVLDKVITFCRRDVPQSMPNEQRTNTGVVQVILVVCRFTNLWYSSRTSRSCCAAGKWFMIPESGRVPYDTATLHYILFLQHHCWCYWQSTASFGAIIRKQF